MAKKNYVVKGEYEGSKITGSRDCGYLFVCDAGTAVVPRFVSSYEVISKTQQSEYDYNKGYIGRQMFGFNGWLMGTDGIQYNEYQVLVVWKETKWDKFKKGGKSLFVLDDEYYSYLVRGMML